MNDFIAIIPYHNPCRWRTRPRNYQVCVDALHKQKVDTLTIECGYLGKWDIPNAEIKTHSSSIIWQKERLINHAISTLPPSVKYIAWVDGDMLFTDNNWVEHTIELLQDNDYVQLFDEVHYLTANNLEYSEGAVNRTIQGVIAGGTQPGGAWAARREALEPLGIYDKHIVGGGDSALLTVLLERRVGLGQHFYEYASRAARQDMINWSAAHIARYQKPRITFLPQHIAHLFHGTLQDRNYGERAKWLRQYDFNPHTDIVEVQGAWEWASEKKEFHDELIKYFKCRNEDLWQ